MSCYTANVKSVFFVFQSRVIPALLKLKILLPVLHLVVLFLCYLHHSPIMGQLCHDRTSRFYSCALTVLICRTFPSSRTWLFRALELGFSALQNLTFPCSRTRKSPTYSRIASTQTSLQPLVTLSLLIKRILHFFDRALPKAGIEPSMVCLIDRCLSPLS